MANATRYATRAVLGGWQRCRFEDLKKQDVFRLYEADGSSADGETSLALSDAYYKDGAWRVQVA